MASVAIRPTATSSTQKPEPGATRTTLLPAGVSRLPAVAIAAATTITPSSAAASRTRALDMASATSATSIRLAR